MEDYCPKNHKVTWECGKQRMPCGKCEAEERKRNARRELDHKLDLQRQENERNYAEKLAELDEQIDFERRSKQEQTNELERERILKQREQDLEKAKKATQDAGSAEATKFTKNSAEDTTSQRNTAKDESTNQSSRSLDTCQKEEDKGSGISKAKQEWEYQKRFEHAKNNHIDALMDMIGLESVKQEFINIKTRVDTCFRQNADISNERFGVTLLGNPGTGM